MSKLLSLAGAVIGGVVGYLAFVWILRQGFYAVSLPGALLGAGCGTLSRDYSRIRGLLCGVAGTALGIFSEWRAFPFKADDSLGFFVAHLHEVAPVSLLFLGLGGILAYYFGKSPLVGRAREPEKN